MSYSPSVVLPCILASTYAFRLRISTPNDLRAVRTLVLVNYITCLSNSLHLARRSVILNLSSTTTSLCMYPKKQISQLVNDYDDGGLSIGAYVGIVLGILVVSSLIQFVIWRKCQRYSTRNALIYTFVPFAICFHRAEREPPKHKRTKIDSREPLSVNNSPDYVALSAPYQPGRTYRKDEAESYEMNQIPPPGVPHGSHY
ncbi:hypothetical protein V1506DRAFT_168070 [Lipomyces tetrasporus]